ncbi:MAG: glycosyltransferase family 9 protein, partial [Pseudomonadota bacterium]
KTVPAKTPYLGVPPTGADVVPTLDPGALKIAIAWAGSATHRDDRRRSCPFAHFLELAGVPGIALYSIQRGPAADDLPAALGGPLVFDLGRGCKDFADNAARLAQMDLVITVDTAIAHLAGALAKPVWTLLSAACDWRWMDRGEHTPWYPTMRLFRQKTLGDWDGLFARVHAELAKTVAGRSSISIR